MKNILFPLFALLLFASCEKEVDLKIPEQEGRLTIHALNSEGDTIYAVVGRSRSILARRVDSLLYVKNATVLLWEDGGAADTMRYDADREAYLSRTVAKAGKQYRIIAMLPGYANAEATALAPAKVPIRKLERLQNVRTTSEGFRQDELRVSFADPASSGDYYGFDLLSLIPDFMNPGAPPYQQSLDPCVQTADTDVESIYGPDPGSISVGSGCAGLKYIFLRDDRFNGSEKELRFYVDHNTLEVFLDTSGQATPAIFQLLHRSDAHIRYLRSREAFYAADGNPFAEPTNVIGNVQGGYGIFVIESKDEKPVP